MARRYLVTPLPGPGVAVLPGEVAHHLARVARARTGDRVVLFDGAGREAAGRIATVAGRRVEVELDEARVVRREPAVAIAVAFGVPRAQRAEWLFEHGCEVGIARFLPLVTERTRPMGDRVARWRRIVAAAAGQCDRSHVPVVEEPGSVAELVARSDMPAARWVAALGGEPLGAAAEGEVLLVVGPEGGFSDGELELLRGAGFVEASLGPLTLRTETAVIAGAVLLAGGR